MKAWKAYCHGNPAFHRQVLVSNPTHKAACQFFKDHPKARFCMLRVSEYEMRNLLRCGVAGVLGHPRISLSESRYPRHCEFNFPAEGWMWVVYRRDWCSDAFLPDVDDRYRPGCILIPHLPGDLPPIDPDEADIVGDTLWRVWESSAGKSLMAARKDATFTANAIRALWLSN